MQFASMLLFGVSAIGVLALGLKYLRAKPPVDYHAAILEAEPPGPATLLVLRALYRIVGATLLAIGIMIGLLTIYGVGDDLFWAKAAVLVGGLIAGGVSVVIPRDMERQTGVRTPWRIVLVLTTFVVAGFILSMI